MRINKYLAHNGYSTRLGGDELVKAGKVTINGRVAVLGDKVEESDVVEVHNARPVAYRYFAYNKPIGVVSDTQSDGERSIMSELAGEKILRSPKGGPFGGVSPIGRLDKLSHGLIILTDDGRVTDRLLNPSRQHEKEYVVETGEPLRKNFKSNMERGIDLEDYTTKPCKVAVIGNNVFSVIITEGKRHQIRRMVVALHNTIRDLKRTRIMNIKLHDMPDGNYRAIEGDELKEFLTALGL